MGNIKMNTLDHLFHGAIDVADDFGNRYSAEEFIKSSNFQGAFYFFTGVARDGLSSDEIRFYLFQ